MPYYEHVFIARRDISGQQVEALAESFAGHVTAGGGKVTKTEFWGLRGLAYRIKKNRKGHYVLMNIDSPHPAVAEMERNMRLSEDVIRFLTLRVDELQEGPSVVMQQKASREERSRRDGRDDRDRPAAAAPNASAAAAPNASAAATTNASAGDDKTKKESNGDKADGDSGGDIKAPSKKPEGGEK